MDNIFEPSNEPSLTPAEWKKKLRKEEIERVVRQKEVEKQRYEKTGQWGHYTKCSDLNRKGILEKIIYFLSCFNCGYECSAADGYEHWYIGGKDVCAGNEGTYVCCCACLCCCPCCTWPHFVRQQYGVDYDDFFGGPGLDSVTRKKEIPHSALKARDDS